MVGDVVKVNNNIHERFYKPDVVDAFRGGFCAAPASIPCLIGPSVHFIVVANTIGIDDDGTFLIGDVIERREFSLLD